ncbi:hypothetical protein EWM64_g922 [Hericium alpestre]|uniref:Cytochrome P450 n=1 Tax=Hericium alpestre TaxID=135208 RepID=A0A4Z0A7M5_9AGAM|nr:hypothetical protein EWM64_g922 [Hericium alpestre]
MGSQHPSQDTGIFLRPAETAQVRSHVGNRSIEKGLESQRLVADDANIEKVRPNFGSVVADGSLTVVAGSDTSATVMTTFFYYILLHPEYMKDVRAEVDAVYSLGGDVFDALKNPTNVPFMTACLQVWSAMSAGPRLIWVLDDLGMRPCGFNRLFHRVALAASLESGRGSSPGNTEIYVPGYSLHRDPRYFWPHPDGFWPMRWLLAAEDPNTSGPTLPSGEHFIHNATAFIPFSSGPANCVAKNLAWQEIRTIVGMLVHEFDVQPAGPLKGWERGLLDHYVLSKAPLRVVLSARAHDAD